MSSKLVWSLVFTLILELKFKSGTLSEVTKIFCDSPIEVSLKSILAYNVRPSGRPCVFLLKILKLMNFN